MNNLFRPFLVLIWLTASSHCVLERAHAHPNALAQGSVDVAGGDSARAFAGGPARSSARSFQLQFHHHHVPNSAHAHSIAHLLQIDHSGDFESDGACQDDAPVPLSHSSNDCDVGVAKLQNSVWSVSDSDGVEIQRVAEPLLLQSLKSVSLLSADNSRFTWPDSLQFFHRLISSTRRAQAPPPRV